MSVSKPGCCAVNWKCSNFQESGTQNLEIGMKVRKIKYRRLEDCFFLVSYFVMLFYFFALTF